jgi:hypothetical protein
VPSQPAMVPQEHNVPEGAARAASPKSATPLRAREELPPWRSRRPGKTQVQPCCEMSEAVTPEFLNSSASRGRLPSRSVMMPRTTRRSWRATLSSVGWRGRASRSSS